MRLVPRRSGRRFGIPIRRPHFEPPTRLVRRPAQATVGHLMCFRETFQAWYEAAFRSQTLEIGNFKPETSRVAIDFRILSFEFLASAVPYITGMLSSGDSAKLSSGISSMRNWLINRCR